MTVPVGMGAVLLGSLVAAVAADLVADVPRLGVWLARRAERLLPERERAFYGFVAEAIAARDEAWRGERARASVLVMASGMVVTGLWRRAGSHRTMNQLAFVRPQFSHPTVKVMLPPDPEIQMSEGVWAEHLRDDLYRIDNHVLFNDYACCGDIVRAALVQENDYEYLEFVEVVSAAEDTNITLMARWRLLKRRQHKRLHRRLFEHGMFVEWISPGFGRGTLPEGRAGLEVEYLLARQRVDWELTERAPYVPAPAELGSG